MKEQKLLKSCISQLRELHDSSEMTLADRQCLALVITRLEALETDPDDDDGGSKRAEIILRGLEFAARILVKVLLDQA